MKKKILLSTLIILMTTLPLMAFQAMEIVPFEGSFDVPLANEYYKANEDGSWNYDGSGSAFSGDSVDEHGVCTTPGKYSNAEIVAIAELQRVTKEDLEKYKDVTVTVSCPNGMFFVSQSNPAFKFPFELQLFWKDAAYCDYEEQEWDPDETWRGDYVWPNPETWVVTSLSGQEANHYIEKNGLVSEQDPETTVSIRDGLDNYPTSGSDYDAFRVRYKDWKRENIGLDLWADIVLVLPGKIDTINNTVTYNNVVYPLIEADDYTALVTITMEYGGKSKSITIPFSGSYDRDDNQPKESTCSLLVNPYSTAAHLSITEDRGSWVPVGSLDFMLSTAAITGSTKKLSAPIIFASSSNDPETGAADDFRLVHESVKFNTPLTQTNSIGFDVRIRNLNADGGTSSCVFDGTATEDKAVNGSVSAIKPAKVEATLDHNTDDRSYYLYNGEIEVMMDPGTNVMLEGRYTGTVYIHVIADETGV